MPIRICAGVYMANGKKREMDLVAEFEEMLRDQKIGEKKHNGKSLATNSEIYADFTRWLRPFVKSKLGPDFDDQVGAVNVSLEISPDGFSGKVKVLVFSGVALPSLPKAFWVKNISAPVLCEGTEQVKWHEATITIRKHDEDSRELISVPYFYKEKSVRIVHVEKSKLQAEFDKSVMEIGEYKPHLKLLLSESVYNISRQEEYKSVLGQKNSESVSAVLKEQHRLKMQEWDVKLKKMTDNQKSCQEDFFVSDKDLSQVLLSQDQVTELLNPALKKNS